MNEAETLARDFFNAMPGPRRWGDGDPPPAFYLESARAMLREGAHGETFRQLTRSVVGWARDDLARIVRRARGEGPTATERLAAMQHAHAGSRDLDVYVRRLGVTVAALEQALDNAREIHRLATAEWLGECGGAAARGVADADEVAAAYEAFFAGSDLGQVAVGGIKALLARRAAVARGEPAWCGRAYCKGSSECNQLWCSGDPGVRPRPRRRKR
jgi:hypothetical protein